MQNTSIGEGTFGSVWKVRDKKTNKIFAIKVINKNKIIRDNMIDQIKKEISIMYKLNHPNIIKLFSHFEDDKDICLIMEYASNGDLSSIIKRPKRLEPIIVKKYMEQIISSVKYLHSFVPPIIHGDIKLENILLDEHCNCKLTDFGWSNFDYGDKNKEIHGGTPQYLSPEIINKTGYDKKVDIWAIGVLFYEMLTGENPFNSIDNNKIYTNIQTLQIKWIKLLSPLAEDLLKKILCINPNDRLSLDEILSHPWFIETPSLSLTNYKEKQKLNNDIILKTNDNNRKRNDTYKKESNYIGKKIFVKIIKNDENSIKETNIDIQKSQINSNLFFY